jgi:DNA-binding NarL/FixJ family response regulator
MTRNATHILVVEDDLPSRQNLELMLTLEGFAVSSAAHGMAGWEAILKLRPALVICDILMPVMSGLELLARVRANEMVGATPFIFLTALGDAASHRNGMNLGADDYLAKPFAPDELIGAINARLRRHDRRFFSLRKDAALAKLSARERDVIGLIGKGLSSKDIAAHLSLSVRTVDAHRASLLRKLDVPNAVALVQLAARITRQG